MSLSRIIPTVILLLVLGFAPGCAHDRADRPKEADKTVLLLAEHLRSGDQSAAASFLWVDKSQVLLANPAIRRLGERHIDESTLFVVPQSAAARNYAPSDPFSQRVSIIGDYKPVSGLSQWEDVAGFKIDLAKTRQGWLVVSGTDIRKR